MDGRDEEEEEEEEEPVDEGALDRVYGPNGRFIAQYCQAENVTLNVALERFRVDKKTYNSYVFQFRRVVTFWAVKSVCHHPLDEDVDILENAETIFAAQVRIIYIMIRFAQVLLSNPRLYLVVSALCGYRRLD